jgi:hypothetical protein
MKKHLLSIQSLWDEFNKAGKIIPASLLPYIHLIELGLKMAKLFANDDTDKIIDEILAAIALLENS